ncbi:hypothetical protein B0H94_105201 [Salsuginibacillus halophilus]|uniref:Uncharacterized protein n=1 Tax=Salsuginibacillus halophilus TaxID=517424 RepID=A0A2P8HLE7_9BACI|nr:hypothetical protein B0H94_105201 [Salsuginibacillus halophilus]
MSSAWILERGTDLGFVYAMIIGVVIVLLLVWLKRQR